MHVIELTTTQAKVIERALEAYEQAPHLERSAATMMDVMLNIKNRSKEESIAAVEKEAEEARAEIAKRKRETIMVRALLVGSGLL